MTLKSQWVLLALFTSLPYLVLGALGAWWLYEAGWGLWWLAGAALVSLIGWPLMHSLHQRTPSPATSRAGPAEDWSPAGMRAWASVEAIARRAGAEDLSLERTEPLMNVAREVVEAVAHHFYQRSSRPVLEIPVPHVLRIAELVA